MIHHTTPKISPLSGVSRASGLDPDYIVILTSSGTNPGGNDDGGNGTTLKFTTGDGGKCSAEWLLLLSHRSDLNLTFIFFC